MMDVKYEYIYNLLGAEVVGGIIVVTANRNESNINTIILTWVIGDETYLVTI